MRGVPYSHEYDPAAPVLPVEIEHPYGAGGALIRALLDTGSDLTVLPADIVVQLRLPRVGTAAVAGFDGLPQMVTLCAAKIRIAGMIWLVKAAGYGAEALVGRDVLNRLSLQLNGPRELLRVVYRPRT